MSGLTVAERLRMIHALGDAELVWDGCHKIYVILTPEDRFTALTEGYEPERDFFPTYHIHRLWTESCELRFVRHMGLTDQPWTITQGETDQSIAEIHANAVRRILEEQGVCRFGPLGADHPSIGKECPACHVPFKAGDYTTLVSLGPGQDEEEMKKAITGRPYNAVAIEVHYSCCTGLPDLEVQ